MTTTMTTMKTPTMIIGNNKEVTGVCWRSSFSDAIIALRVTNITRLIPFSVSSTNNPANMQTYSNQYNVFLMKYFYPFCYWRLRSWMC